MNQLSFGIVCGMFCLGMGSAQAAPPVVDFPEANFDPSIGAKLLAEGNRARRPANSLGSLSESSLAPDFVKFRNRIHAAATPDDLEVILTELDTDFDKLSPDAQYFAAQVRMIQPFRGVLYRLRPILERRESIHSLAVSGLKQMTSAVAIYLPTSQWKVGLEYLSAPSARPDTQTQFKKVEEFQQFLVNVGATTLQSSITRVQNLLRNRPRDRALVFDAAVLYGPQAFKDDLDRYRAHGDSEILATLGGMYSIGHQLLVFGSYNFDDTLEVTEDLLKLQGLDTEILFREDSELGVTARDRTRVLKKYSKHMTLLPNGARWMPRALKYLKAAVSAYEQSWQLLENQPENSIAFFNPAFVQPSRRQINLALANIKASVEGQTVSVRSMVTGEVADVNLAAFFLDPPKDLKAFLPTGFDDSPQFKKSKFGPKTLEHRNYYRGRAIRWNSGVWSSMIPGLRDATGGSVPLTETNVDQALRVLSQAWGGAVFTPLLDWVIR